MCDAHSYRGKNCKISKNCHDNVCNIATKHHSALQINFLFAFATQRFVQILD
ncbi:hypothetical protein HMPREF1584_00670 [Gardnerella vaginalis JCP8481A]|uniref:Uncharacterized protein n=1 Tax=Gardnerella vaginalis TaxID=2702 RepID=A0A133NUW7_GARVA|nr:hypothetical protein HMPREF1584_00670 [Gardnerella vaginalis JCP8481A]KXA20078.1 hypothetical protein HMPREF3208_00917 [Gardnerella vaginalis]